MLSESSYGRIWQQARRKALTSAQARSPLAARPYDLRHSGVTLQLNAGVPTPEVARRAGHGVAVLLREDPRHYRHPYLADPGPPQ